MLELSDELCGMQELMVLDWDSLCITKLLEGKLGLDSFFNLFLIHAQGYHDNTEKC